MSNLKALKTRIQSVESTKKITSAMYMVAAAKFRQAQKKLDAAKAYATGLQNTFNSLPSDLVGNSNHPLLAHNDSERLVVLFSGDKGLCGGFNAILLKRANAHIKELRENNIAFKLVCIGQKAIDYGKKNHPNSLLNSALNITLSNLTANYPEVFFNALYEHFKTKTLSHCSLLFNTYTSPLVQTPKLLGLLPIEKEERNAESNGIAEFLPSSTEFLERFIHQYIYGVFWSAYTQTVVGEYAARMSAMDSSTNNCNDMINTLKLEYNQQRQDKITKELVEIISGAEALQKG